MSFALPIGGILLGVTFGATKDLGGGFLDHGVATPISHPRGIVATADGEGRNVVLIWLFDHRGGYALLAIYPDTGKSVEFPTPFPYGGDCPYASILSSKNRYYTHFNSHFVEFDCQKMAFTFWRKTAPQMAMSMTEDDNGVIWSATYPQCGLVSFDPKMGEFKDYGHIYKQNWAQYPRYIAVDDSGWVYIGIGYALSQVVAFNPKTGDVRPMFEEVERQEGVGGFVVRDLNGKVYGHVKSEEWFEFYRGQKRRLDKTPSIRRKPIITGSQDLFHRQFPDGRRVKSLDLAQRLLVVEDPKTGEEKSVSFDYSSEGGHIMGLAVSPDGTVCGGTAFPFWFFSYDPKADRWTRHPCYGQWNTVARQGRLFFVGGYTGGFLLEWDPFKEWVPTRKEAKNTNPLFLAEAYPHINRPHDLLPLPDGRRLVLAGTPAYGLTGGGLLIFDRGNKEATILKHTEILLYHSTMSLVALPEGRVLGGTTTAPGTGGMRKAKVAELYILNLATKQVEWHKALIPGVSEYTDLCLCPKGGLVYGFADRRLFFVFDPKERKVVHLSDVSQKFGPTTIHQGPRVFVKGQEGEVFVLFVRGIGRVDPKTFEISLLAKSPVPITAGGDYLDGRVYFASHSRLCSYRARS